LDLYEPLTTRWTKRSLGQLIRHYKEVRF